MASYHRNLVKEDESEVSGTLLMKGSDSEPIQLHYSLQNLVVYYIIIIITIYMVTIYYLYSLLLLLV